MTDGLDETSDDIASIVAEAAGDSVTEQTLTEPDGRKTTLLAALEDGEQPHYLLRGRLLDYEEQSPDDEARRQSRKRKVASAGGELVTLLTDRRLFVVVERKRDYESLSIPYRDLSSVTLETAQGQNQRLVARTAERTYYIDTSTTSQEECTDAEQFLADRVAAAEDRESGDTERDPLTTLERLAELHDQGALTDEEFEAKKADLLDRI